MMYSKYLAAAAALFAPALAAPQRGNFGCAAVPSDSFLAASKELVDMHREGKIDAAEAIGPIPVHFHVVTSTEGTGPSDETLQEQLQVMNDNYGPHDISFEFVDTSRTVNPSWAKDGDELAMKTALRKGSYSELNVYFLEQLPDDAFGYCHFPVQTEEGSDDFNIDGCSILATTVPGGSATHFNQGKTVTHEVGHWFGLFHTFQDGCDGGDDVADTPAQQSPTSGCPASRDSCPNDEGQDPIHNYMDYSWDECYEEFTAGQADRIRAFWPQFRG